MNLFFIIHSFDYYILYVYLFRQLELEYKKFLTEFSIQYFMNSAKLNSFSLNNNKKKKNQNTKFNSKN